MVSNVLGVNLPVNIPVTNADVAWGIAAFSLMSLIYGGPQLVQTQLVDKVMS